MPKVNLSFQASPVHQSREFFASEFEPSEVTVLPLRSTYLQVLPCPAQLHHRGAHQVKVAHVFGLRVILNIAAGVILVKLPLGALA